MTLTDDDRVSAKVEELDRLIAELQKRKTELIAEKEAVATPILAPKSETVKESAPSAEAQPPKLVAKASSQKKTRDPLEGILDALPWKSFKKKEGEWAFLRDREGRLIDELQSQKDFVDKVRKEGQLVVGKYRYQVSEDKFLNRYYAGA